MKTTAKNSVTINGQLIPWSFVWRVHTLCGKDWDETIDCFWKARHCTGDNGIQRYIMSGFKPDERGNKFMLRPSKERESGKMDTLRTWWEGLYTRRRKPEFTAEAAEIVAALSKRWEVSV
jgi:hypothetical protein